MLKKLRELILPSLAVLLALAFLIRTSWPAILKFYISIGVGKCSSMPILCLVPESEVIDPPINQSYLQELVPFSFEHITIYLPKDYSAVKEIVSKSYYKKKKVSHAGDVAYVLYEEPDFFINLFPEISGQGLAGNYEFWRRTMCSTPGGIKNVTDAFFIVIKSIFASYGDRACDLHMIKFKIGDKRGFITYNLCNDINYFDCNMVNDKGEFFKAYIKDKGARLGLDKIFAIISTINGEGKSLDFSGNPG